MNEWQLVLLEPARVVLSQISQFVLGAILVLLILLIGWIIAGLIKTGVTKGLRVLKVDELSDRIELDSLLEKGGIKYSLSELIGVICYWLAILVTFVVAINAVGLTIAAALLERIVSYIPNVIVAIFVLILGMFIATVLRTIIQTAAVNAGIARATMLSKMVEILIILFAAVTALKQLRIDVSLIDKAITITLASLGLALALALGLGCKDIAARIVSEFIEKMKK